MTRSPKPQQLSLFNAERQVGYRLRVWGGHGDPFQRGPALNHQLVTAPSARKPMKTYEAEIFQLQCTRYPVFLSQCVGRILPVHPLQHQPFQT
jgi:hypothetical protein